MLRIVSLVVGPFTLNARARVPLVGRGGRWTCRRGGTARTRVDTELELESVHVLKELLNVRNSLDEHIELELLLSLGLLLLGGNVATFHTCFLVLRFADERAECRKGLVYFGSAGFLDPGMVELALGVALRTRHRTRLASPSLGSGSRLSWVVVILLGRVPVGGIIKPPQNVVLWQQLRTWTRLLRGRRGVESGYFSLESRPLRSTRWIAAGDVR